MADCAGAPGFVWPRPSPPSTAAGGMQPAGVVVSREPLGQRRQRQRTPPQTPEKHKRHKLSEHAVSPLTSPDRFMPVATAQNEEQRLWQQMDALPETLHAADQEYSQRLRASLSPFKSATGKSARGSPGQSAAHAPDRAMSFGSEHSASPVTDTMKELRQQFRDSQANHTGAPTHRQISHTPERILDAPGLRDDFYLNLLDWSLHNTLAVGLGRTVYLWHAASQTVTTLMQTSDIDDYISSVKFSSDGSQLAVGTASAKVRLFDMGAGGAYVRDLAGHTSRVSALAWNTNNQLSTAGRDSSVLSHDLRAGPQQFDRMAGHTREVCGLAWSCDSRNLASGGNDNLLCVWDARKSARANAGSSAAQPRIKFAQHCAAVKALAWHPRRKGLLASGGGSTDCTLRLWDTDRAVCKRAVETGSQVASVVWNTQGTELVTAHGYSNNQLALWTYPKLQRVAELTGHHARALHLALSPDGTTVVSGSADETLRFWKLFEAPRHGNSVAVAAGRSVPSGSGESNWSGARKAMTNSFQPTIR